MWILQLQQINLYTLDVSYLTHVVCLFCSFVCYIKSSDAEQSTFRSCCGKIICNGCLTRSEECIDDGGELLHLHLCPLCKAPPASSEEEEVNRITALTTCDNAEAYNHLAHSYASGGLGLPQDWSKATELYLQAGELGCAEAYYNLGIASKLGRGIERDSKMSMHYYKLAAIHGDVEARYHLGILEGKASNFYLSFMHHKIAAGAGHEKALDKVKQGFVGGIVTKEEYEWSLHGYQKRQDEIKRMR